MKKLTKILLSTVLTLIVLFTMAPASVYASQPFDEPDELIYEDYDNGYKKTFVYGTNGIYPGIDKGYPYHIKNFRGHDYNDYWDTWLVGERQYTTTVAVYFKNGTADNFTLRAVDILNNKVVYEFTYQDYNGQEFYLDLPPGAYRFIGINKGSKTLVLHKYEVTIG